MHVHEQLPTGSRTAQRGRIRARLRRNRALGSAISLLVGFGVLAATIGTANADPSAGDWLKLRTCESGGNYAINTGNGYYGAYQFDLGTWRSVGGSGLPSDASPATQDALAYKLWQERGWSPWTCAAIVGLPEGGSGGPAPVAKVSKPVVHRPVGSLDLDAASSNRTAIRVAGWALDPNSPASSIAVRITVNGAPHTAATNLGRVDVDHRLRVSGNHGFSVAIGAHAGTYTVCATALGRSAGNNTSLGCRTVTVKRIPVGSFDSARVSGGRVIVTGWALDPNNSGASVRALISVNGVSHVVSASGVRRDVASALHVAGRHGFTASIAVHPGVNKVCATTVGIDGFRTSLGCRSVRMASPVGSLDKVSVSGKSTVITGWSMDPNFSSSSTWVHVSVNSAGYQVATRVVRADVNRSLSVSGAHGFRLIAALPAGTSKVCAVAMGRNSGNNTSLGCVSVRR